MSDILDVCCELSIKNRNKSILKIPFVGKGNIWIDNTYDSSINSLSQYIMYEAINKTAPGQLSIIGYDSDLSGVFAPFSALSSGEYKCLELIFDEKGLWTYLNYIWQHIQSVQNVIQGRKKSLIDFRNSTGQPVEGYKLVVLSLDMGMIENKLRSMLAMLMRNGPAYGVSFLIISSTYMSIQTQNDTEISIAVNSLAPNIKILETRDSKIKIDANDAYLDWTPYSAEDVIRMCDMFSEKAKCARMPLIPFEKLHNLNKMWDKSSIEGLTFSIGKYGINDVEITIGDEINQRHNMLITGAVGQGKSNLISVIIHSLCLHYSPKELRMYLLDFKEGVTFKSFSNIGQNEYLPHAKSLGLESDISFGLAVLESLFLEYQNRMNILKEHNMRSIHDYRIAFPNVEMPRILVVIDEFQMMFGDNTGMGQKVSEIFEKSVRLFRAAGIHFILASQSLSGNLTFDCNRESIFAQIPIRIALKNSEIESKQTLSSNNIAAAYLRPREAIVNLDYGEVSQNKKTVIAYADESVLVGLRRIWWEKAHQKYNAPYVFENLRRITISRSIDVLLAKRHLGFVPAALIGEKISVDGNSILLPLPNEPGRNIAILGSNDSDCNQAIGIIQSIAISLAIQHTKGDARFLFFDFTDDTMLTEKKYPEFALLMESIGYYIECMPISQFEKTISSLLNERKSDDTFYVFGIGLDKWKYEKDDYVAESPLKNFVENAPAEKIHFIGWWTKASAYTKQVNGYGDSDAFNSKIFLRIDERTVQSLTNPFVKWSAQQNRGLISDDIEFSEETIFIPYAPINRNDINKFKSTMWT